VDDSREARVQILGIDLGFGFTKATDGRRSLIVKSVIGQAEEEFGGHLAEAPRDEDHLHLELEDRSIFVGELAERQSSLRSFTLDQDRFMAESATPLALAVSSVLAEPGESLRVVTGLPIDTYRAKAEDFARMLRGRHSFTAIDAGGRRQRIALELAEVHVIPQPFGSLYDLILDEAGQIGEHGGLHTEKVGIIDVGFQTSDFTVSDRTSFLERASGSTELGIARAFAVIAAKLREKSGVAVELYRLYEGVQQGRLKIRGNTYELHRLIEHVFGQLAADLAAEANRLWGDEWDMDAILITGGGGAVLAPYLAPLLRGNVLPVDASRDARLNNVRGFHRFGRHLWARDESETADGDVPMREEAAAEMSPESAATAPGSGERTSGVPY
jgi:plasmid segregation protein ParM